MLHVHQTTANGRVASMVSVGPKYAGPPEWTFVSEQITAASDSAAFVLHLTMNSSGTVWYGRVSVTEVTPASGRPREGRPASNPAEVDGLAGAGGGQGVSG